MSMNPDKPVGDVVAVDREGSLWLPTDSGWFLPGGSEKRVTWDWWLLVEAYGPMRLYRFSAEYRHAAEGMQAG